MPIYEYHCKNCNKNFEEWLKVSEAEKDQICPECGKLASRFLSQTSFVLKGEGWYVTEYGKNSASSSPTKNTQSNETAKAADTKKSSENSSAGSASAHDSNNASANSSNTASSETVSKKESNTKKAEAPASSKASSASATA